MSVGKEEQFESFCADYLNYRYRAWSAVNIDTVMAFLAKVQDGSVPMDSVTSVVITPTEITFSYLVRDENGNATYDYDRLEPTTHHKSFRIPFSESYYREKAF